MRNEKSKKDGKKELILKLRSVGYSYRDIQKEYGFSKGTISYHCGEGQKEKYLIRNRKSIPNRRELRLEWLYEKKHNLPCNNCGAIVDPSALDYHHIIRDTKNHEIGRMINGNWALNKIQEEIDKCVPLCAICHRIETSKENNDFCAKKRNGEL